MVIITQNQEKKKRGLILYVNPASSRLKQSLEGQLKSLQQEKHHELQQERNKVRALQDALESMKTEIAVQGELLDDINTREIQSIRSREETLKSRIEAAEGKHTESTRALTAKMASAIHSKSARTLEVHL